MFAGCGGQQWRAGGLHVVVARRVQLTLGRRVVCGERSVPAALLAPVEGRCTQQGTAWKRWCSKGSQQRGGYAVLYLADAVLARMCRGLCKQQRFSRFRVRKGFFRTSTGERAAQWRAWRVREVQMRAFKGKMAA